MRTSKKLKLNRFFFYRVQSVGRASWFNSGHVCVWAGFMNHHDDCSRRANRYSGQHRVTQKSSCIKVTSRTWLLKRSNSKKNDNYAHLLAFLLQLVEYSSGKDMLHQYNDTRVAISCCQSFTLLSVDVDN